MKKVSFTDRAIRRVEAQLHTYIGKKSPVTLYEPARYLMQAGGKRLRAGLVCLSSALVSGRYVKAIPAAAAVELLHNFSLVHDDIMDKDDLRRGRATIHKKWNSDVAILSGDFICALAYRALNDSPEKVIPGLLKIFTQGYITLCEGQALDKEFEQRPSITVRDYLSMISKKTASLFSVAMALGATVSGASSTQQKSLTQFGLHCGLAFQIQDDLLDIVSDESTLGKDIGSDLRAGKKTYVFLLATETKRGKEILAEFPGAGGNYSKLLLDFKEFIHAEGIQEKTEKRIARHMLSALKSIRKFKNNPAKEELNGMIHRIWNRKH